MHCKVSRRPTEQRHSRGVTLVELVIVLTLLAIIASVAAIALRDPVIAYRDSQKRAELTDVADAALRRMARDIRLALPNSVRVNGGNLELLLTRTGGRYRSDPNNLGQGDVLDFAATGPADTSFDTIGPMNAPQAVAINDILVIYNLYAAAGIPTANAYTYLSGNCALPNSATCNTARVTAVGPGVLPNETKISFTERRFPTGSPGNRFYILEAPGPVTYACVPGAVDANGNGTGTLRRVSGYNIALAQAAGPFPAAPILAKYVTGCSIDYNNLVLTQSLGLVSMTLTLTRGGESVTLYHEVHVSNIP